MTARALLLVGFVATTLGLFFGPWYVQRHVVDAIGGLLGGPTHGGGWFIVPWFLVSVYLGGSTVAFSWKRPRGAPRLGFPELLQRLSADRRGWITSAVLLSCTLAVFYGSSEYWYATFDELTLKQGWGVRTVTYSWSQVSKRFIGCVPRKLDYYFRFDVTMLDGQSFDLGSARQTDIYYHLPALLSLTNNADTKVGDIQHCPPAYRDILQRLVVHKAHPDRIPRPA